MSEAVLMGASAVMSVISFVFYCSGAAGASYKVRTLKLVNWAYTHVPAVEGTGDDLFNSGSERYTLYMGLRAYAEANDNYRSITNLSDCGDGSVCNACYDAGRMVLPLVSLCVIFSFVSLIIALVRMMPSMVGNKCMKFAGMVTTFITIGFSIAAFSAFAPCRRAMGKEYPNLAIWGPGFGLTVAAWILTMFAFVLQAWKTGEQSAANHTPEPVPQEIQLTNTETA